MNRFKFFATALLLLIGSQALHARAIAVDDCPTITVDCPDTVGESTSVVFTATITGGSSETRYTYDWTVSAGTIISGQGTNSITVDSTAIGGQSVTATVNVGGIISEGCSKSYSCTVAVIDDPIRDPIDSYGNIRFEDEKARLDNFAIAIQAVPGATGYIVVDGPRTRPNRALNRATRAKRYLMNVRGFKDNQIVLLDARERDEMWFVLWIVPQGAVPPSGKPF